MGQQSCQLIERLIKQNQQLQYLNQYAQHKKRVNKYTKENPKKQWEFPIFHKGKSLCFLGDYYSLNQTIIFHNNCCFNHFKNFLHIEKLHL